MSRGPAIPEDDALLSAADVMARLHLKSPDKFRRLVERTPALRAARRYRGARAYFLRSGVVAFQHFHMSGAPEAVAS